LAFERRFDRLGRDREHEEERVSLRVDLFTTAPPERIPQQPLVLNKSPLVALRAEFTQKPSGALDVREEQRDLGA
jgi:hypothetical protein